jgi:hypothetical protein
MTWLAFGAGVITGIALALSFFFWVLGHLNEPRQNREITPEP